MAFEKPILEWDAQGVEPPSQVRTQGWKPLESPAPDYFNYMWHTTGEALKELQEKALDKTEVGGDLVATLASLQSQITANTNNFNDFLSVKTLANGSDPNTTVISLIRTNHANAPAPVNGNTNWTIFTLFNTNRSTTSNRTQLAMGDNDGTMLFRAYKSGAWSSWKQVSDITDTQNRINVHAQNNKMHTHYATATGTNTLTLTASTFVGTLGEGDSFRFKNPNNSTANMTLNVNSSGARPVRDANGNLFNRGKSGVVYTVCYDGVNFQLQGEGGEYGTAIASDVLTGKTIGTATGLVSGTMPNRGVFSLGLGVSVPPGYYSGGTTADGKKFFSGIEYINTTSSFQTVNFNKTGLGFTPSIIGVYRYPFSTSSNKYTKGILFDGTTLKNSIDSDGTFAIDSISLLSNGFQLNFTTGVGVVNNQQFYYIAIE